MTFNVFCHRILKTQDHRVVWVEKDIKNYLVPTALPWPGTLSTKLGYRGPLPTWNISRDGTSTASMGELLTVNNSLISNLHLPCQFKATAPCSVTSCPCERSLSSSCYEDQKYSSMKKNITYFKKSYPFLLSC